MPTSTLAHNHVPLNREAKKPGSSVAAKSETTCMQSNRDMNSDGLELAKGDQNENTATKAGWFRQFFGPDDATIRPTAEAAPDPVRIHGCARREFVCTTRRCQ